MEGKSIIIKKVKKGGHGGGHGGGTWKVAYADFVTAMMAFFLLLWLLSMVSPENKKNLSNYFKYFSIFDKSGTTLLEMNRQVDKVVSNWEMSELASEDPKRGSGGESGEYRLWEQSLKKEIEAKLPDLKDQIMINTFEGGVRIELVEKAGSPMFPSGSTELTPEGKRILKVLTETIKETGAKIAIEGHTDARSYASGARSNWELSTERASAARKEIEKNGFAPDRLVRIAGYAATQPLIKENAYDPKNRRISILLFNGSASAEPSAVSGKPQGESGSKVGQIKKRIPPRGMKQFDPVEQYLTGR